MVMDRADGRGGGRRVAIAKTGDEVATHIARADTFAVYDCSDGVAERGPDLEMPAVSIGFLLAFLQGHRVDAVVAGNTGGGLRALLEGNGIEVVRGVDGGVADAARAYAAGNLGRSDLPCTEHDACNGCGICG
ncbi:MAG: NifB/NifX family molybdenum-iron cluster-binding protein [Methanospirillum sp.]